ncbi:site-specific integrase [Clostridium botulinum]|uniref:Phage integrase family protein n=1 Tax=Clostridium botulinum (strain Eklund 17B / Type B) TaxID=935198 RepID=B2TKJ3_CLOBB|nr:phage integrase family protein [Clostridium botulinum B str. Eklund 17B (NRP)]MBY6976469.1 site-specific integrase [Clostridium botulinum]MBY7001598.1 site-specific integrase [Clostridium botulinum]MCR1274433.1 site-specific integrase [Clostridium botulinum]NFD69111.1 site-specific integrase [Clostridium botulinum]
MQGSVRKRGNKWYYYFDVAKSDGKRKKIERAGGNTKKEALEALRKALSEYDNVGTIITESNISVSDYFDYWFNEYVLINCKYSTQVSYKRLIKNHLKPSLGIYQLKKITSSRLQELINLKYRNGFSKNYLGNLYGVLSGAFKYAVYPSNFIKENPMTFVKMPKYNTKLINNPDDLKIITLEDYNNILKRFPYGSNMYIPLQISFNTGLRAAEVMSLTWDCIDFENQTLRVEKILYRNEFKKWVFGSPKTHSSYRTIKIGNTLLSLLKKFHKDQKENKLRYGPFYVKHDYDFVCLKENGELLTTDSLKYLSKVVNYELGIDFKFHSLRHTHATMLLEAGANIKDIQQRLGHSKLATTMDVYSHVTKKMSQDSVRLFEEAIKKLPPS